ncbi:pentatricopeptide repeat-containing protein At5g39710 [Solanum lycopersicum]|uniref:pentatricopeptide repeat-containing protein At5g39710 n=1 Tax=Solanum lycopersicum TaxID=4081 RepID=UPI0002768250|nr:pentatricopeptide repeat-containing protein At5g39710 [Solanum lycopersicum]XP_025884303.1 pentatricopeptide repeat-containing protein At5g39710 [Solanum lycopersicum]XP_025884304.1 pentatricopeptide repeat-containing protein At5g39710 [Solanum lycopersicum]XP_025884306.1 pentatricopeptide repeat-containing protein At5g39710 [Solanum lycopersicum]XP_025884307.1 pentatricopeptide repeat-containing protein At5g39710 [Solanum lycopersicum]XP_025884308.1 pentatricopeptide repeat-containing prot
MLLVKPYRRALHSSTRQVQCKTLDSPSPSSTTLFVDRAVSILKGYDPISLDSISSQFTPQYASSVLFQCRFDKPLVLRFINWARNRQFFNLQCKCISIHILTRFKLYKTAQSLAEDVALKFGDNKGELVFSCLRDTYYSCKSSSAVFDLMVKSYSHLKMIDRAMNIFELAKFNGFMLTVLSYNSILDALIRVSYNGSFELAQKFYDDMVQSGVSPNVYTYNIMIRGLCAKGELQKSLVVFNEMEKNGCLRNVVTYNTIIGGYCKIGKVDEAVKLLKLMQVRSLEPSVVTYNAIINGLCREGRMKETSEILEEMRGKGLMPDEVTYNTLVNGYCREGNFHQALVLHSEMLRNGLSPDVVTYTSLINSMCKTGNLHRAMEFFDQLHARGLYPNDRTYTTLIVGFSQQGLMNEAYKLLNEMISNGFSPSIVTYNALINGHCAVGRMEDALRVTQEMEQRRLVPDVVTYSTIISGFCRNCGLERAFCVKQQMVEKGVLPDVITYSSLIQGLCEQRRLTEAFELFQEMFRVGLQPDKFTYTTLIGAYCANGDIKGAFHLHNKMIYKGCFPDVVTYNVLINGLNKQARTREAKRLLFKLLYEQSVPNCVTYDMLIESCKDLELKSALDLIKGFCMKGLLNEADQVFELMLQKHKKPSEVAYSLLIHGHSRGGNLHRALNLFREMANLGFIPHTVSIIVLMKELFKEGMSEELHQVIQSTLETCKLADGELAKVIVEVNYKEGNMDAVFNALTEMAKDGLLPNSGKTAFCHMPQ